jgi:predicted aldo/keto reductase-like oxidoreductase
MTSIPTLPFGKTGHGSTRIIFGAAALWGLSTPEETQPTLDVLLRYGVNHIDVAASYGRAERRVGEWMPEHRSRFFLATKTPERRTMAPGADPQVHRAVADGPRGSAALHNLVDLTNGSARRRRAGRDRKRASRATRFIGVTGHGVTVAAMHLRSLERFPFDSVLLPYNYAMMQNAHYAADFEALANVCGERGVAMQTINITPVLGDKDHTHTRGTSR